MSDLDTLRRRLTPETPPASHRFCSIRVERPKHEAGLPSFHPGELISLRLGVEPGRPKRLRGYLFAEESGRMLAMLDPVDVREADDEVACSFALPEDLPSVRLCLVIEGVWTNGMSAGCEISFEAAG